MPIPALRSLSRRAALLAAVVVVAGGLLALGLCAQGDAARDRWQRPQEVMDALGLGPGSRAADVGCGEGYFVLRLAERVGPEGTVFAVDIDEDALEKVRRRAERDGLTQVRIVHGAPDDPRLPEGELDAVLTVNAYHEMREYDAMLAAIFRALRPGGRLALIDAAGRADDSREELTRRHTMSAELARADAERHGFRFLGPQPGFERPRSRRREWFFLLFEKPAS